MSGDELADGLRGAYLVICNDYELELIRQKTGLERDRDSSSAADDPRRHARRARLVGHPADDRASTCPPCRRDSIVDPTGVGDAYRGGLMKGLAHGADDAVCARLGSVAATYALEHLGGQSHAYTAAEFRRGTKSISGNWRSDRGSSVRLRDDAVRSRARRVGWRVRHGQGSHEPSSLPSPWCPTSLGWLIGVPWLVPFLNAAWRVVDDGARAPRGPTRRAITVMLVWAATMAVVATAMAAFGWSRTRDGGDLFLRPTYRDEMIAWVRTGVGAESLPSVFVPRHLAYAARILRRVGRHRRRAVDADGRGADESDGRICRRDGRGERAARRRRSILGWHPWAVVRIVGFVIIGVVLSGVVLSRVMRFPIRLRAERRWLVIGARLLVVDLVAQMAAGADVEPAAEGDGRMVKILVVASLVWPLTLHGGGLGPCRDAADRSGLTCSTPPRRASVISGPSDRSTPPA